MTTGISIRIPVSIYRPWLRLGGGDLQLLDKVRSGCSLLLGAYVCRISQLHQALVLQLLLHIPAPDTATVSRARDLGLITLAVVLQTPRSLAVATCIN